MQLCKFWPKIVRVNHPFAIAHSFMVDAADHEKLDAAKQEFSNLLEKPQLQGIPVLVLGNKRDLPNALEVQELIQRLLVTTRMSRAT